MKNKVALGNKIQIILKDKFKTVEYFAQKFIIPGFSFGVTPVGTSSTKLNVVGDSVDFEPLTITMLVDEELNTYKEIYNDMMEKDPETGNIDPGEREYDISVVILTSKNNPVLTFRFIDAKINNVGALMYDVANSERMFFDLTFIYDYYTII